QLGALGGGGLLAAPRLQAPLAEVVQLPVVEVLVEGAGEGEAGRVPLLLRAGAQPGEQLHRPPVQLLAALAALQRHLEGDVAQVLQDHHPGRLVVAEDGRDADLQPVEVAVDVDEGELGGGVALGGLLALLGGVGRHHHHHPRAGRFADAVVGAVGGVALELLDRRGAGAGSGGLLNLGPEGVVEFHLLRDVKRGRRGAQDYRGPVRLSGSRSNGRATSVLKPRTSAGTRRMLSSPKPWVVAMMITFSPASLVPGPMWWMPRTPNRRWMHSSTASISSGSSSSCSWSPPPPS